MLLRMQEFTDEIVSHLPIASPTSLLDYPNSYKGRKKTVYINAVESLLKKPLTRKDAAVTTFVKSEKLNLSDKPDPVPRVIQPRSPRYHVSLGRYIKHIEHDVMNAIDKAFGSKTIMSGLNSVDQATAIRDAWESVKDPVAIGLDASRFDQHVSSAMLGWEHSIWLQCYKGTDTSELEKLLNWQLHTRGHGKAKDGRLSYKIEGKRMSGDVNTSAGNKLIMCGMVFSYMKHLNIPRDSWRLINNGDDCVLIVSRQYQGRFRGINSWFKTMGFKMDVEQSVNVFEKIEFCQCHPVWDGTKYRMMRKFPLCLDKDTTIIPQTQTARNVQRWAAAVGKAGLSLTGGLPIMQELYVKYIKWGSKYKEWSGLSEGGLTWLSQNMQERYQEPTDEARISFWEAFGVAPGHQMLIEDEIRKLDLETDAKRDLQFSHYRGAFIPALGLVLGKDITLPMHDL